MRKSIYEDPDVGSAYTSDRVLFVGTREDYESLKDILPGTGTVHCRSVYGFWEKFFGTTDYSRLESAESVGTLVLSRKRSVPARMITTGKLECCHNVHDVSEMLSRIADEWGIPIEYVETKDESILPSDVDYRSGRLSAGDASLSF